MSSNRSAAAAVDRDSRSGSAEHAQEEEEEGHGGRGGLRLTERAQEPQEEDEAEQGGFRLTPNPAHLPTLIPRRDRGQNRDVQRQSQSHAEEADEVPGKGGGKDGEEFFSQWVSSRQTPSRPGTGVFSSRGSWTRAAAAAGSGSNENESWQLPPNISGESGPGTKGGLGGEQLRASLSQATWDALTEDGRRALSLLGRSTPWPSYSRICIRWPGNMWETFQDKDSGEGYVNWQRRSKEEEMELVVRGRAKGTTLTLLGSDKQHMADFLRRVLESCSKKSPEVAHMMNKAVSSLSHASFITHQFASLLS